MDGRAACRVRLLDLLTAQMKNLGKGCLAAKEDIRLDSGNVSFASTQSAGSQARNSSRSLIAELGNKPASLRNAGRLSRRFVRVCRERQSASFAISVALRRPHSKKKGRTVRSSS